MKNSLTLVIASIAKQSPGRYGDCFAACGGSQCNGRKFSTATKMDSWGGSWQAITPVVYFGECLSHIGYTKKTHFPPHRHMRSRQGFSMHDYPLPQAGKPVLPQSVVCIRLFVRYSLTVCSPHRLESLSYRRLRSAVHRHHHPSRRPRSAVRRPPYRKALGFLPGPSSSVQALRYSAKRRSTSGQFTTFHQFVTYSARRF